MTEDNIFNYKITWGALDPIGHLRGSVYTDFALDAQFNGIDRIGYSTAGLSDLGYGPVLLRQESRYYNEVRFGDSVTDTVHLAGLSGDGSRWLVRHDFTRSDGEKSAMLKVEGTWIDLQTRDAIVPPEGLISAFQQFPRDQNFRDLRSLVRNRS